jgi:hypothetical protein
MKDHERLDLLKEIGGTRVYEERRKESLKIMMDTGKTILRGLTFLTISCIPSKSNYLVAPSAALIATIIVCSIQVIYSTKGSSLFFVFLHELQGIICSLFLLWSMMSSSVELTHIGFGSAENRRKQIIEVVQYIEERLKELDEEKEELKKYQQLDKQRRSLEYTIFEKELLDARQKLEEVGRRPEISAHLFLS